MKFSRYISPLSDSIEFNIVVRVTTDKLLGLYIIDGVGYSAIGGRTNSPSSKKQMSVVCDSQSNSSREP